MSGAVGDGGRAVEAAVESERPFIASDSVAPPLFVDRDIAVWNLMCHDEFQLLWSASRTRVGA